MRTGSVAPPETGKRARLGGRVCLDEGSYLRNSGRGVDHALRIGILPNVQTAPSKAGMLRSQAWVMTPVP